MPFYPAGAIGSGDTLWIAMVVGLAFGFFLERGGLGSGVKLAAQFYLTDLTVFKVMFTAIATAAAGLTVLSAMGWLDLTRVLVPGTFLLAQVTGGLIFGIGFVVGGYCPGTGCVALASGRGDAVVLLAGMAAGVLAFGELFPLLRDFYTAAPMGRVTLDELLGLSRGVTVGLVLLVAAAGFVLAERIERSRRPA